MSPTNTRSRRQWTARLLAVVLLLAGFMSGRLPQVAASEADQMADGFDFVPLAVAMPAGLPTQTIRPVNQDYHRLTGWVSSVGAGIAMADLTGDGLANDLCITDPRTDQVVITPAPVPDSADRYPPFVLAPDPLPMDRTMAPMGCAPGDFNADGRMDILVYYWGRTPIIFLAGNAADLIGPDIYHPVEMVSGVSIDGNYRGPLWNTNAVAVDDFDGDGFSDVLIGNYWPDGPVLDDQVSGGVTMPRSLSHADNGGESYVYRFTGGTGGSEPTVSFTLAEDAIPPEALTGWSLGAAAVDLDGDFLPELYLAHDFGPDQLLHNRSTVGEVRFETVRGPRDPLVPRSKIVGRSSFKGMGVDFADFTGDGRYDIAVSNITTSWGIHESNFAFVNIAGGHQDMRERMLAGEAPFEDRSAPLGVAWSGWGWDIKLADLDNNGDREIVQATGFVKGKTNRWAQLQEMASANDELVANPQMWPHVREGDDIAGNQTLAFFVRSESGRFVNLSGRLGLAVPVPTRGIAFGDADGDGRLEVAVARQWEEPVFYHNQAPAPGEFIGLRLRHASGAEPGTVEAAVAAIGSPVVGAQVRVTAADGRTFIGHVDGGSGHSGKRSHDVHIGLGEVTGPLAVEITWRDRSGQVRTESRSLSPGWHDLSLGEPGERGTA